jgi:hypothetical protein
LITGCSDKLEKDNSALREQIGRLSAEKDKIKSDRDKLESELIRKQGEIAASAERLADSRARIDELKQEVTAQRAFSSGLSDTLKANERQSKEQKMEFASKIADLETQLQKLKTPQKGELTGVVTYFFNENFGDKPDVGAEITIFPADGNPGFDYSVMEAYRDVKYAMRIRGTFSAEAQQILGKYHISNARDWQELDSRAAEMMLKAMTGGNSIQLTADGNGAFKRSLQPGSYFVMIRSKHRKGMTVCEIQGKIVVQKIEIKSSEEISVDAKFDAR